MWARGLLRRAQRLGTWRGRLRSPGVWGGVHFRHFSRQVGSLDMDDALPEESRTASESRRRIRDAESLIDQQIEDLQSGRVEYVDEPKVAEGAEEGDRTFSVDRRGMFRVNPISVPTNTASRSPATGLVRELIHRIQFGGPMTVAEFMQHCLGHPLYGYYTSHGGDRELLQQLQLQSAQTAEEGGKLIFGRGADFVTGPELGPLYGECMALWVITMWQQMGCPKKLNLVEIGAGSGKMLRDMMTIIDKQPALKGVLVVHIVENSEMLREAQRQALGVTLSSYQQDDDDEWSSEWGDDEPADPLALFVGDEVAENLSGGTDEWSLLQELRQAATGPTEMSKSADEVEAAVVEDAPLSADDIETADQVGHAGPIKLPGDRGYDIPIDVAGASEDDSAKKQSDGSDLSSEEQLEVLSELGEFMSSAVHKLDEDKTGEKRRRRDELKARLAKTDAYTKLLRQKLTEKTTEQAVRRSFDWMVRSRLPGGTPESAIPGTNSASLVADVPRLFMERTSESSLVADPLEDDSKKIVTPEEHAGVNQPSIKERILEQMENEKARLAGKQEEEKSGAVMMPPPVENPHRSRHPMGQQYVYGARQNGIEVVWHWDLNSVPDFGVPANRQQMEAKLQSDAELKTAFGRRRNHHPGPILLLAHELFDALPVHQFRKTEKGWCEVLVDVDSSEDGEHFFRFVLSSGPTPASMHCLRKDPPTDTVAGLGYNALPYVEDHNAVEVSPVSVGLVQSITKLIEAHGGAAVLIDYGSEGALQDSLLGIKNHERVSALQEPGRVDLSAHVNFALLADTLLDYRRGKLLRMQKDMEREASDKATTDLELDLAAADEGAGEEDGAEGREFNQVSIDLDEVEAQLTPSQDLWVSPVVTQTELLRELGVEMRALLHMRDIGEEDQESLNNLMSCFQRLVGTEEGEMGALYKAICIARKDAGPPVGFQSPETLAAFPQYTPPWEPLSEKEMETLKETYNYVPPGASSEE